MNNFLVTLSLSLVLLFSACRKDKVAAVELPEGFIENDWAATKKAAAENDRKIFIHFYKPNCDRCATFKKETLNDAEVEAYIKDNMIGAFLNTEESDGKDVSAGYGIDSHPGMAIADKDGNLVVKRIGIINKADFLAWLKENQ